MLRLPRGQRQRARYRLHAFGALKTSFPLPTDRRLDRVLSDEFLYNSNAGLLALVNRRPIIV
jgi:hypothetical protein